MRMQARHRRGGQRFEPERIRLQIVAFVDVCFLLLLYFIMAGTLADDATRLATTLATKGTGAAAALVPQQLRIGWVGGRANWWIGQHQRTDRDELRAILSRLPREVGLVVIPDPDSPLEATVTAVQIAREVGFTKISYITSRR